jgi:hypothetical protein
MMIVPTCPVCQGQYALSELRCSDGAVPPTGKNEELFGRPCHCPRCQQDIYSWRKKDEAGEGLDRVKAILGTTYPLVMTLAALVLWMAGSHPHWVGSLLAVVLSLVPFLVLKNKAPDFRTQKWARPFLAHPGPSLELIELGSFVVGLGVGLVTLILMKYWILPPAEPDFLQKLAAALAYALFFVLITIALTGMMVNAQIRKLDKVMPQPVFTNADRLLRIALESARQQLGLDDADPLTVEGTRRTDVAGIEVVFSLKRRSKTAEKTLEKTVSRRREGRESETVRTEEETVTEKDERGGVARWAVTADMWGRVRSIEVRDWWSFVE